MILTIVHRYSFTLAEAAQALLADKAGDCDGWHIAIEGETVVIDVIAPWDGEHHVALPADFDHEKLQSLIAIGFFKPGAEAGLPPPETPPSPALEEPARKGGPLATKAGILCNEKAFQTWLGVAAPDAAKAKIYERCGIGSRVDLDYEDEPAARFKEMTLEYEVWCQYGE